MFASASSAGLGSSLDDARVRCVAARARSVRRPQRIPPRAPRGRLVSPPTRLLERARGGGGGARTRRRDGAERRRTSLSRARRTPAETPLFRQRFFSRASPWRARAARALRRASTPTPTHPAPRRSTGALCARSRISRGHAPVAAVLQAGDAVVPLLRGGEDAVDARFALRPRRRRVGGARRRSRRRFSRIRGDEPRWRRTRMNTRGRSWRRCVVWEGEGATETRQLWRRGRRRWRRSSPRRVVTVRRGVSAETRRGGGGDEGARRSEKTSETRGGKVSGSVARAGRQGGVDGRAGRDGSSPESDRVPSRVERARAGKREERDNYL